MRLFHVIVALVLFSVSASAQFANSPKPADLTTVQSQIDAITSAMPQPASTVPPLDTVPGAVGASVAYQRADAVRPRLSRTLSVTLNASGIGTADWSSVPLPSVGKVTLTPIYGGTGAPKCWLTAAASTTSAPIKCVIESTALINLSIVTSGLTLNTAANGMVVDVLVLPATQ